VVRYFCQRVVVMYLGRVVETGPVPEIFVSPLHPYTKLLKASSPEPDPTRAVAMTFQEGEPPSPVAPPPGCHFHPRCPLADGRCRSERPDLRELSPGRSVACHHAG
jgi:oligopeptide/dipeptide ABC transporter ATP-binding protein